MRKYLRQIAKARLAAMGVGNINRKMANKKDDGRPLWRVVTSGESGREAERIQLNYGLMRKARKQGSAVRNRRKIRKVEGYAG
jgi:hypothetical protein